jgi:hypothetical protein
MRVTRPGIHSLHYLAIASWLHDGNGQRRVALADMLQGGYLEADNILAILGVANLEHEAAVIAVYTEVPVAFATKLMQLARKTKMSPDEFCSFFDFDVGQVALEQPELGRGHQ